MEEESGHAAVWLLHVVARSPVSGGGPYPVLDDLRKGSPVAFDFGCAAKRGNGAVVFFPGQQPGMIGNEFIRWLFLRFCTTMENELDFYGRLNFHRNAVQVVDGIIRTIPFYIFRQAGSGFENELPQQVNFVSKRMVEAIEKTSDVLVVIVLASGVARLHF